MRSRGLQLLLLTAAAFLALAALAAADGEAGVRRLHRRALLQRPYGMNQPILGEDESAPAPRTKAQPTQRTSSWNAPRSSGWGGRGLLELQLSQDRGR